MKKVIIIGIITILGLGFLSYNFMFPKAKEKVLRDDNVYLIYISHADCSACQTIANQVEQYRLKASSNDSLVPFYKIDLKYVKYTDAQEEFGIKATPTLLYIRNGRVYKSADGTEEVLELFAQYYGKI